MASCILLAAVAGSIHAGDFNVVRIAANNWAFCRKTELNKAGFTLDRRQGSQAIWIRPTSCRRAVSARWPS